MLLIVSAVISFRTTPNEYQAFGYRNPHADA